MEHEQANEILYMKKESNGQMSTEIKSSVQYGNMIHVKFSSFLGGNEV